MINLLPKTWIEEVSKKNRDKKFADIYKEIQIGKQILDIGVWCKFPEPHASENWLEKQPPPGKGKIYAVGLEKMNDFACKYPRVLCVQANGCALPFAIRSVDIAISNAVLEHVPETGQIDFICEISRVCRDYALLTVPDRFCPIEIHSRIFFLHWFPGWRKLFDLIGEKYWGLRKSLASIFTKRSLLVLLEKSSSRGSWHVNRLTLFGIPISLIAKFTPNKEDD